MFGAIQPIYYINRSIATKVELIWAIDHQHTAHMSCVEREPVKFRSLVRHFPAIPHMSIMIQKLFRIFGKQSFMAIK